MTMVQNPIESASIEPVQHVWIVGSKTFSQVFGNEDAARTFVSQFPPSISGGMAITCVPVIGAIASTPAAGYAEMRSHLEYIAAQTVAELASMTTSQLRARASVIIDRAQRAIHASQAAGTLPGQQAEFNDKVHGFIDSVIEVAFQGGDLDGGTIQEWAETAGLIEQVTMTEPCDARQNCRCAADGTFPLTCYRKTYVMGATPRVALPTRDTTWVSVKDGLPKTDNECTSRELNVSRSFFVKGIAVDGGEGFGLADYQEDGKWHSYGGNYDFMHLKEVTHYLPVTGSVQEDTSTDPASNQLNPHRHTEQTSVADLAMLAHIWALIQDYAKHLAAVDFWSGKVRSSAILDPAYAAEDKLRSTLKTTYPENQLERAAALCDRMYESGVGGSGCKEAAIRIRALKPTLQPIKAVGNSANQVTA